MTGAGTPSKPGVAPATLSVSQRAGRVRPAGARSSARVRHKPALHAQHPVTAAPRPLASQAGVPGGGMRSSQAPAARSGLFLLLRHTSAERPRAQADTWLSSTVPIAHAAVSRPAAGLMVRGSALRADSPRCSRRGSAAPISLRSLRSLRSDSGAESALEAREYARLSRSSAPLAAHKSPVGGPSHLRSGRSPPTGGTSTPEP